MCVHDTGLLVVGVSFLDYIELSVRGLLGKKMGDQAKLLRVRYHLRSTSTIFRKIIVGLFIGKVLLTFLQQN